MPLVCDKAASVWMLCVPNNTLTRFDLQSRTLSLLAVIRQLPIGQKLFTKQSSSYLT